MHGGKPQLHQPRHGHNRGGGPRGRTASQRAPLLRLGCPTAHACLGACTRVSDSQAAWKATALLPAHRYVVGRLNPLLSAGLRLGGSSRLSLSAVPQDALFPADAYSVQLQPLTVRVCPRRRNRFCVVGGDGVEANRGGDGAVFPCRPREHERQVGRAREGKHQARRANPCRPWSTPISCQVSVEKSSTVLQPLLNLPALAR